MDELLMATHPQEDFENRPEWAATKRAADILGVSESYLHKARVYGDGPPYTKFGHAVRYHLPTVRQWALARMQQSTSEARAA